MPNQNFLYFKNPQSSPTQNPKHKKQITQSSRVQNHLPTKIPNPKKISPEQTNCFCFFRLKALLEELHGAPEAIRQKALSKVRSEAVGLGFPLSNPMTWGSDFSTINPIILLDREGSGFLGVSFGILMNSLYPFSHNHGSVENHPK